MKILTRKFSHENSEMKISNVSCIVYVHSTLGTELNRLVGNVGHGCSVLQCVAVCCSVSQCVAVRCTCPTANWVPSWLLRNIRHYGRVLQCVAVCCSVLQCVAPAQQQIGYRADFWETFVIVVMCCSVLQCVAVRCTCPTANWVPSWLLRNIWHLCCSWYFGKPLQRRWNFSKVSYTVCVYSKFNTELTFENYSSFLLLMTCLCGVAEISRKSAV